MGGLLVSLGLLGLAIGAVGAIRGHVSWAGIRSRKIAAVVVGASLAVTLTGGFLLPTRIQTAKNTATAPPAAASITTAQTPSSAAPSTTPPPAAPPTASPTITPPISPPPTSAVTSRAPQTPKKAASLPPATTRLHGVMDPVPWWSAAYPAVPTASCIADGGPPIGIERSWQLRSNAIVCYDEMAFNDTWKGRVIDVNVLFPTGVVEQQAISISESLLPTDSRYSATFDGVNNGNSAKPGGTCRERIYTSTKLAASVTSINAGWAEPNKGSVSLYSGAATNDGSVTPYNPRHIHLAMIGIGGENRGSDGIVHC